LLAAFDLRRQTHIVMAGLNYRFTWGPERRPAVVARY
jgi:hypothetical protein